jgi:hypothetical protein
MWGRVHLRTSSILLVALGALAAAQTPTATVHLLLVDHYGNTITKWQDLSVRDMQGKQWNRAFDAGLTAVLPQGEYDLEVWSLGPPREMKPYLGKFVVRTPSVSYVIGMEESNLEDVLPMDAVRVRFKIPPSAKSTCILSGLFNSFQYFAPVGPDGQIVFENVRAGSFVMTCLPEAVLPEPRRIKRTDDVIIIDNSAWEKIK